MEEIVKTESYFNLRRSVLIPFLLESQGKFEEAIKSHEEAIKALQAFMDTNKKIKKFFRVMFKRQKEVHLERLRYLQELEKQGNWEGVIVSPTFLSANKELQSKCITLVNNSYY